MMTHPYQFALFVPVDRLAESAPLGASVFGISEQEFVDGLNVQIGNGVQTHWATCSLMTEAQVSAIAGNVPAWASFFRWAIDDGLVSTNVASAASKIGEPWSWQRSMDELGVHRMPGEGE